MTSTDWLPLTEPLPLARDVVHVVRVELQADDQRLDEYRSLLSPEELVRADRYKIERPRRHFIICRAILRQLLGSCINRSPAAIEFDYGPHGKPSLRRESTREVPLAAAWGRQCDGEAPASDTEALAREASRQSHPQSGQTDRPPRIEFSVSHSADLALIAITSERRVGIDLEQMDTAVRILKLAARFFSPSESAELLGLPECDQLAGFYRGWTCKEAYLKATGFGLSLPLSKFTVSMNPRAPAALREIVDQPDEPHRWRLHSLDASPGFAAAILVEAASSDDVVVRRWSN